MNPDGFPRHMGEILNLSLAVLFRWLFVRFLIRNGRLYSHPWRAGTSAVPGAPAPRHPEPGAAAPPWAAFKDIDRKPVT